MRQVKNLPSLFANLTKNSTDLLQEYPHPGKVKMLRKNNNALSIWIFR